MTHDEIEQVAQSFHGDRWEYWTSCGSHDWRALPVTESGEHYCIICCTLWDSKGTILNAPSEPVRPFLWPY
jgi:hypothetical protein